MAYLENMQNSDTRLKWKAIALKFVLKLMFLIQIGCWNRFKFGYGDYKHSEIGLEEHEEHDDDQKMNTHATYSDDEGFEG